MERVTKWVQTGHRGMTALLTHTIRGVILAGCLALLATGTPALATPTLQISNGLLTGATGVDVGGTLYDVMFMEGSCINLFSGCDSADDFFFKTLNDAQAASNALSSQVLLDTPQGNFDSNFLLTQGCANWDPSVCKIHTPYGMNPSNPNFFAYSAFENFNVESSDRLFNGTNGVRTHTDPTYAIWKQSTGNPIPEPSTVLLLSTGLLGLAGYRWHQRRGGLEQVG